MHPQNSHPPSLTWSRNLKAKLHHVPLTHTEGLLTTMILHSASLWRTFHRKLIKQHLSVSTAVQTNVTVSCPIYNMFAILLINVRQHYSKHTYSEKKINKSTVYVGMKSNNVVIRLTQFLRKSGRNCVCVTREKKQKTATSMTQRPVKKSCDAQIYNIRRKITLNNWFPIRVGEIYYIPNPGSTLHVLSSVDQTQVVTSPSFPH